MSIIDASRRLRLAAAASLALGLFGSTSLAFAAGEDYPNAPVTMVMPFSAGGAADIGARLLASALSDKLGNQFVVENRTGAAGNIAYASVTRAMPDGYEILVGYVALDACAHALTPDLNWKTEDLEPVAMFTVSPLAFVVHPSVPVSTMSEFVDYVKAHPDEVNFGTPGMGSFVHIITEIMKRELDLDMQHVPYSGTGALMPDALAGNIQFFATGPSSILSHYKSGALKVLAVSGDERAPELPEIPTLKEQGLTDIPLDNWYGVEVPKGTPEAVKEKLEAAIQEITSDPAMIAEGERVGVPLRFMGGEAFVEKIAADRAVCTEAIKAADIKLQ